MLETQGSEQRKKVGKERRKVTQRKKRTPEKERKTINVQLKVKSQRTIARSKRNEYMRGKKAQERKARKNKENADFNKYK